mmetsp:Transcript_29051/g.87879  ORF Transcript_29051/g.87879 Transcript_29051/m.87879 type:complete len:356 (+) Transcript_29051:13-1080(+)
MLLMADKVTLVSPRCHSRACTVLGTRCDTADTPASPTWVSHKVRCNSRTFRGKFAAKAQSPSSPNFVFVIVRRSSLKLLGKTWAKRVMPSSKQSHVVPTKCSLKIFSEGGIPCAKHSKASKPSSKPVKSRSKTSWPTSAARTSGKHHSCTSPLCSSCIHALPAKMPRNFLLASSYRGCSARGSKSRSLPARLFKMCRLSSGCAASPCSKCTLKPALRTSMGKRLSRACSFRATRSKVHVSFSSSCQSGKTSMGAGPSVQTNAVFARTTAMSIIKPGWHTAMDNSKQHQTRENATAGRATSDSSLRIVRNPSAMFMALKKLVSFGSGVRSWPSECCALAYAQTQYGVSKGSPRVVL